jgi:hypothetical protein
MVGNGIVAQQWRPPRNVLLAYTLQRLRLKTVQIKQRHEITDRSGSNLDAESMTFWSWIWFSQSIVLGDSPRFAPLCRLGPPSGAPRRLERTRLIVDRDAAVRDIGPQVARISGDLL